MKQPWTRLGSWKTVHPKFRDAAFRCEFMKHHRQASEIMTDKKGTPLAAVYFTPEGMNNEFQRKFFESLRERLE